MSTFGKVDPGTLGWVKGEIDETLKQARLALESYAENPSDSTRLRFCITHLHQVVGTLTMVELDGAAMLARETEQFAESLLNESAAPTSGSLELLTRAIVTLPDYLARLQFGQNDAPFRHLSLINEMRAARGGTAVSALDLFAPDIGVRPPTPARASTPLDDAEYRALARSLRPGLQNALLAWLRDPARLAALADIGAVFDQLRDQAGFAPHEQLFWVAGGLVEALRDGFEVTVERKKLFARIDQQLKRLADDTEKSELRKSAELLVRALLWEIAHSPTTGSAVTQLQQAFSLGALLPAPDTIMDFQMPAPEVLASVATALGTEISAAQDLLTTYFDPANRDPQVLDQLREQLRKMGGTLDMLGVPPLKHLVDEIGAVCAALAERRLRDVDAAAMPVAEALLLLESGVRDIRPPFEWARTIEEGIQRLRSLREGGSGVSAGGIEVGEAELTEAEFKQLLGVVAHEVGANLGRIEETLEAFAADTARRDTIHEVPGLLSQIQGAMQILGQERAAGLVETTRGYVDNLVAGTLAPTPAILDALAVCVGTIGAYMEGLHADRRNLDALIAGAESEMTAALATASSMPVAPVPVGLPDLLEQWLVDTSNATALARLQNAIGARANDARTRGEERMARIADETERLLALVADDGERLVPDVADTLRHSVAALVAAAPASVAVPAAPKPPPVNVEPVDDEIREIFIEDARDVLSNMARYYETWRNNKNDKEALAELRRGFHTLKGSGRMVNASEIAEFAWSIENLLNRVRDGKLSYGAPIVDIVGRAQEVLPGMVDHYAGGPAPTADIESLRLRAHELAQGGGAAVASAPRAAASTPSADLPRLDGALKDIFTNEARGHLENLRREIEIGRREGARPVSEVMFRSTHTLAGNARSLGVSMMAEACHEVEKMLQVLRAHGQPVGETELTIVDNLYAAVSQLVELLNQGAASSGDLAQQFGALTRAAQAATPGREAHVTEAAPAPAAAPGWNIVAEVPAAAPAPRARAAAPASKAPPPEVDPELLEIFHEEAGEILNSIDGSLARLRADADDRTALADLKRALHTLKGGGRMAGVFVIGDLAHVTEGFLKRIEDGAARFDADSFGIFEEVHDVLVNMLDRLEQGQSLPSLDPLYAKIARLAPGLALPESASGAATETDAPADEDVDDNSFAPVRPISMPVASATATALADVADDRRELGEDEARGAFPEKLDRRGQIKVRTQLLNELVNYAGEVSISRSRMEQQIHSFRDNLGELSRNVVRFRDQIRELEIQSESQILYRTEKVSAEGDIDTDFDPLEFDRFSRLQQLTRQLAESLHDLSTIQNNLGTFVGEAETVLLQQARLNTDLQEGLMRTRMVSFDTIAARLRHIARTTARELGKNADIDFSGAEVEIDRTVLERMIGPFEHMIRNSLDHGIETPEVRRERGKPAAGRITIVCAQEGSEIVIRFSDDGAGLNIEAVRDKAIERGMLAPEATLSDEELIQFILLPGFSTATKVTHLSGRGVGMDVVHNEVKQLGGSMSVDTHRGAGAAFIIRLPLTLSIAQALMVYVGEQMFAIPLASIANIIEFPIDKLSDISVGRNPMLEWQGQVYPYMHLGKRLHVEGQPRNSRKVPVLLARAGSREVAMQVDGLGGTREVVIKSIGTQLTEIKGLAGATILGDGRVVLILDVPGLWYRDEAVHIESAAPRAERVKTAAPVAPERPVIMVVDDSLTVRKVTGKHLQKRGMEVLTAKDGVDAVEQLRDRVPDVMLVDIEMPRMDGYELTQRIRAEERLKHVPIIMITSRAGAKHRQRAFELGVDMYMSKPYQEDELFRNIDTLLEGGRAAGEKQ